MSCADSASPRPTRVRSGTRRRSSPRPLLTPPRLRLRRGLGLRGAWSLATGAECFPFPGMEVTEQRW